MSTPQLETICFQYCDLHLSYRQNIWNPMCISSLTAWKTMGMYSKNHFFFFNSCTSLVTRQSTRYVTRFSPGFWYEENEAPTATKLRLQFPRTISFTCVSSAISFLETVNSVMRTDRPDRKPAEGGFTPPAFGSNCSESPRWVNLRPLLFYARKQTVFELAQVGSNCDRLLDSE